MCGNCGTILSQSFNHLALSYNHLDIVITFYVLVKLRGDIVHNVPTKSREISIVEVPRGLLDLNIVTKCCIVFDGVFPIIILQTKPQVPNYQTTYVLINITFYFFTTITSTLDELQC